MPLGLHSLGGSRCLGPIKSPLNLENKASVILCFPEQPTGQAALLTDANGHTRPRDSPRKETRRTQ